MVKLKETVIKEYRYSEIDLKSITCLPIKFRLNHSSFSSWKHPLTSFDATRGAMLRDSEFSFVIIFTRGTNYTVLIYKLLLTTVRNIPLVKLINRLPWTWMSAGNWLCMTAMSSSIAQMGKEDYKREVCILDEEITIWVTSADHPSQKSLNISPGWVISWTCTFQAHWLGIRIHSIIE